jgi:hypothetical protein
MKKLLMILPMALILCFMVGCQDKEAMAELEAMKAQAEVEEQNKEVVHKLYESIDKQDFDAFLELCASDGVCHIPGLPGAVPLEAVTQVQKSRTFTIVSVSSSAIVPVSGNAVGWVNRNTIFQRAENDHSSLF